MGVDEVDQHVAAVERASGRSDDVPGAASEYPRRLLAFAARHGHIQRQGYGRNAGDRQVVGRQRRFAAHFHHVGALRGQGIDQLRPRLPDIFRNKVQLDVLLVDQTEEAEGVGRGQQVNGHHLTGRPQERPALQLGGSRDLQRQLLWHGSRGRQGIAAGSGDFDVHTAIGW